jgi:hypothetical protein
VTDAERTKLTAELACAHVVDLVAVEVDQKTSLFARFQDAPV